MRDGRPDPEDCDPEDCLNSITSPIPALVGLSNSLINGGAGNIIFSDTKIYTDKVTYEIGADEPNYTDSIYGDVTSIYAPPLYKQPYFGPDEFIAAGPGGESLFNYWAHRNGELVWVEECSCNRVANALGKFVSDFFNAPSQLIDWIFSTDAPKTPGDVLAPNGQPVGHVEGGATPDVRTVTPGQMDGIIDGLKGLGAKPGSRPNYPGDWYDLPNNQGGFGVRDSRQSGRTVDVNIPGVPDVTKVHQKKP